MHPTPVFLLENPVDKGARQATVPGIKKNPMRKEQLARTKMVLGRIE